MGDRSERGHEREKRQARHGRAAPEESGRKAPHRGLVQRTPEPRERPTAASKGSPGRPRSPSVAAHKAGGRLYTPSETPSPERSLVRAACALTTPPAPCKNPPPPAHTETPTKGPAHKGENDFQNRPFHTPTHCLRRDGV